MRVKDEKFGNKIKKVMLFIFMKLINIFLRIWHIVSWPIVALICVIELIWKGLGAVGRLLTRVLRQGKRCVEAKLEQRDKHQKDWKKISHLLNQIMVSSSPMLHRTEANAVALVLVGFLQLISFFTTFGGTRYYFSQIGILPPLILAGVIQTAIVAFSIRSEIKERYQLGRKIVVAVFVCVSMLFSYVGIANSTIVPYADYSRIYEDAYLTANVLRDSLKEDTEYAYSPSAAANVIYDEVQRGRDMYSLASTILSGDGSLEEQSARLQEMLQLRNKSYSTTKDESGQEVVTVDEEIPELSSVVAALSANAEEQGTRMQMNAALQDLSKALMEFGIDVSDNEEDLLDVSKLVRIMEDYQATLSAEDEGTEIGRNEFYRLHTQYANIISAGNSVYKAVSKLSEELIEAEMVTEGVSAEAFSQKLKNAKALEGMEFEDAASLEDSGTRPGTIIALSNGDSTPLGNKLLLLWNELLSSTTTTDTYENVLSQYLAQTQEMRKEFSAILSDPGKSNYREAWETISGSYDAFATPMDSSIIAFSRLFDRDTYQSMIVPVFLAVLVDGSTILIACVGRRRRFSALYANTNRDYFEEEIDLFEQMFISVMQESDDLSTIEGYYSAVSKTIAQIGEYLALFEPSPETADLGCGLRGEAEKLKGDYCCLTSLMLSLGYLCPLSERQLRVLQCNEDSQSASEAVKYYCLKFRAENYLRQCMARTNVYMEYVKACL